MRSFALVKFGEIKRSADFPHLLLYAFDRDEDCKALRRADEDALELFSFTFRMPVDENYPIQG